VSLSPEQIIIVAAEKAADLLLALVPHDKAHDILTQRSVDETNRLADVAEQLKFGG